MWLPRLDNGNVEARLESLQANPPRQPLEAIVWTDEVIDMPYVVSRRTLLYM